MDIFKDSYVFVLRYNDNYIEDAMVIHKKICDKEGFCWYGKVGKKPNIKRLNEIIEKKGTNILFYNKKLSFIGKLMEVSLVAPMNNVPDYYANSMRKPSVWLKVSSLCKIQQEVLSDLLIISTGKTMEETINSSMTSFYFTFANKDFRIQQEDGDA